MKKIYFIIFFAFLFIIKVNAQINYSINFNVDNLQTYTDTVFGNIYNVLEFENLPYISDTGKPYLPIKKLNFIIPANRNVSSITINSSTFREINMSHLIYPTQKPVPTSLIPYTPPFVNPDSTIYNSNNPFPSNRIINDNSGFFDHRNKIITIEVYPIQYLPDSNKIKFFTNISFTINFTNNNYQNNDSVYRTERNKKLYKDILKSIVNNPQDVNQYSDSTKYKLRKSSAQGHLPSYEYVIITDNSLASAFDDFVNWKKRKGIDIGIVTTNDIYSYNHYSTGDIISTNPPIVDNAGKVRHYLYDAYLNGTVWALIAGDSNEYMSIPIRIGSGEDNPTFNVDKVPTDLYFSDFNGDWEKDDDQYYGERTHDDVDYFSEIFVGRLICSDTLDITNWTHNLLKYEQNPGNGDYSYLTRAFSIQADQMQNKLTVLGRGEAEYIATKFPNFTTTILNENPRYDSPFNSNGIVPAGQPGAGTLGLSKGANAIAGMINHYGLYSWFCHGGTTSGVESGITTMTNGINDEPCWKLQAEDAHDYYTESNNGLDNLDNYNYPSILYSVSCGVTPFDLTHGRNGVKNCGEGFTTNTNAGGAAFLGNTRDGSINWSYILYEQFAQVVGSGGFATKLGVAEFVSKYLYGPSHYLNLTHNLIGCPETEMWTDTPTKLAVSLEPNCVNVNVNNTVKITIDNLPSNAQATVCLYKANEVFTVNEVFGDANNHAELILNNITPTTAGDVDVTITSHNKIPFMDKLVNCNCNNPTSTLNITSNTTWAELKKMTTNVSVKAGATLTITDAAKVLMPPTSKIMIEPDGELVVNGGKITSYCDNQLWQGIEVWGTSNQSQYESGGYCYQGKVVFTDNTIIENATKGITNCNPSYQSTQAGGIILATETNFNNNRVAIDFVPYSNVLSGTVHNNLSYFVKCNFTRDRALYNNTAFVSFADLKTVYGIKFYGCNFEDSYATSYSQQGTGIMSLDSYFEVKPYCNCEDNPCPSGCMEKGSFRNFAYAIRAQKANTNNYFVVDNTNFYHNNRSIMDEGVNLASITSSYFEFQPPLSGSTYETGIAIYSGTGYTIEENQFTATATNFTSTGVYFYHGGQEDNYVYKNWFHDNSVGISTYGVCKNSSGSTGLQFQCNTFENSGTYDINTRAGGSNPGVRNYQGSTTQSEGNIFTENCTGYKNFYNQAPNMVRYYFRSGADLEEPVCNSSTYFTTYPINYTNSCTSHLGGGGNRTMSLSPLDIQTLEQDFITDKNAMLSYQNQYDQLLDGGNTTALGNEIDNSHANNTWQLYNKLLNKSPFLTTKVLYKASNKTNVLPNVLLYNLLKQNPDALNSDNLMEHLANKPLPLYGWMLDSLDICRRSVTARTKLEEKISYHAGRKDQAGFKIIKDALLDTNATNHQRIQTWTNNMETFYSDIMAINDNMATANYQTAENTLNTMPSKYNLEDDYAVEYQWFTELFGLFKQFHNSNKTIYQLDSNDVQKVKYIADNGYGCGKVYARNICHLYGFDYEPEYIGYDEPQVQNKSMAKDYSEPQPLVSKEDNLECYPNPAKEWIVFKWETVSAENSIIITVANSLSSIITTIKTDGSEGEKILDTNEWPIGIYYYKAEKNGQVVKSGKFVISR